MNSRMTSNAPLITSIAAIGIIVLIAGTMLPPLFAATFGSSASGQDPSEQIAMHIDRHNQLRTEYEARFNGRSVFFRPQPPPPPPRVVERPREEPTPRRDPTPREPPPEPGPPETYQGPPVSIVLGDQVMFQGGSARGPGTWIGVGEEKIGIEVLATNAPRSVTVRYQRGEYEVPVFDSATPFLLDSSMEGEALDGLILAPATPEEQADPEPPPSPGQIRREQAAAAAAAEEAAARAAEARARRAEEQGIDPAEMDNDLHPAGHPEAPEHDPEYDPDFDPDAPHADEPQGESLEDPDAQAAGAEEEPAAVLPRAESAGSTDSDPSK